MWKDFKWVEKRFGTKFANILKGFDKGSKEIEEHFTTKENHEVTFTDANGVQNTLVTEQGISEVLAKNGLIEVTWQELKDKRDNGQLIPGSLYRIIDYNCTTTQENTQSAGHQFDIVLLALSENKLAEEGWAMEHPTDVYDVTFGDGVTKKCWIYQYELEGEIAINVVDIESLLGVVAASDEVTINNNKTAEAGFESIELTVENLTYNYFQNSNLSAWKVWYCLDNDTARFTWADDSVDEDVPASLTNDRGDIFVRNTEADTEDVKSNPLYAWDYANDTYYTYSEQPKVGDYIYTLNKGEVSQAYNVGSFTPSHEGTGLPNGRGVIYRLIDEWNNDVPYDFKNIQLYLRVVDGEYVEDGQKIWVYTFCLYNSDGGTYEDGSLKRIEVSVDDTYAIFNSNVMVSNLRANRYFSIPFNSLLGYYSIQDEEASSPSRCEFFDCTNAIVQQASGVYLYRCNVRDYVVELGGIYYSCKKVLTEDALDDIETLLNNI